MSDQGRAMDWDSEVENDGQGWQLLPEGEAQFEVVRLEKTTAKSDGCPMAKLTLTIWNEHGETQVDDYLKLHTSCEWKLCEFFRAIGQRESGQRLRPQWNKVEGSRGRCKVIVETYKRRDGKPGESNKVKNYLDSIGDVPGNGKAEYDDDEIPL